MRNLLAGIIHCIDVIMLRMKLKIPTTAVNRNGD